MNTEAGKRVALAIIAAALALLAFEYRLSTMGGSLGGFEDDQFVHLSAAQQIVLGEWPSRDFVDIGGMPLTLGLSALAQRVGGRTLFSEFVLTAAMLSVCAAVLFLLAYVASGSLAIAIGVALLEIAIAPRFYNYPKLLAYAIGIPVLWFYIDRPTRRRLVVVALSVVVALLFRYDHGVYLGSTAAIIVAVMHRRDPRSLAKEIGTLAGCVLLCVLPYLLFLASHGGVEREARSFVAFSRWATSRTGLRPIERTFTVDTSKPLFERLPAEAVAPNIHVRWARGLDAAVRSSRERALGLTPVEQITSDVWVYRVDPETAATARAVVQDPLVVDTSGIDRTSFVFTADAFPPVPSALERIGSQLGRLQIAAGIFHSGNAVPFMFWLFALLPPVALLAVAAVRMRTPSADAGWHRGDLKIASVALLGLLMTPGLLRGNLGSRLADVSEVAGVCGAWLVAVSLASRSTWGRVLGAGAVGLVTVAAIVSVDSIEHVRRQIAQSRITQGIAAFRQQTSSTRALLSAVPPFSAWSPGEPGDASVARYLYDCTAPDDRIFALSYSPQIYFMSARAFAGGLDYLRPELFSSEDDQRQIIARIRTRRVPIILTDPEPVYTDDYRESFPLIDAYLLEAYRFVDQVDFGNGRVYRVLVRQDLAVDGTYARLDLPCFVPRAAQSLRR